MKKRKSPVERLLEVLGAWEDGQKAKGVATPPPATAWELRLACRALSEGGSVGTINADAKAVLEKCGFDVEAEEVGWRVRNG